MLGAVAWLIKSIVTHFLSKDIDSYKMNIKYSHEADLEQFRSSLKMMSEELLIAETIESEKINSILQKCGAKSDEVSFVKESDSSPMPPITSPVPSV